jgi:hypothetical protein
VGEVHPARRMRSSGRCGDGRRRGRVDGGRVAVGHARDDRRSDALLLGATGEAVHDAPHALLFRLAGTTGECGIVVFRGGDHRAPLRVGRRVAGGCGAVGERGERLGLGVVGVRVGFAVLVLRLPQHGAEVLFDVLFNGGDPGALSTRQGRLELTVDRRRPGRIVVAPRPVAGGLRFCHVGVHGRDLVAVFRRADHRAGLAAAQGSSRPSG